MIMKVDPEFLRKRDPRKSSVPVTRPPEGEETGSASRIDGHLRSPAEQTDLALPDGHCILDTVSTDELRDELHRRQSNFGRLRAKREKLIAEIAALDAEIKQLRGTGARSPVAPPRDLSAPRKRARFVTAKPKNSLKLADAITAAVERGAVVTPTEVADLVKRDGYVTTSKTFAQSVAGALAKHKGFTRTGHGQYESVA